MPIPKKTPKPKLIKSVTLIELIISVTIISVIILSIYSIDTFSQNQVINSDRRAKVHNELAYALDHMTKNIQLAIGDLNDPALMPYADNKGIRVRIDNNPANGRIDTNDRWVAYRHENIGAPATDSEIRYYNNAGDTGVPAGTFETIARHIRITDPAADPSTWGLLFDVDGTVSDLGVTVRGRWLPDRDPSNRNPEVEMQTRINMPSVSVN